MDTYAPPGFDGPEPLTPQNCALLLIDLQKGPVASVGSMEQGQLVANAVALARAAALLELPVVLAGAAIPDEAGEFISGLTQALPPYPVIRHSRNNAWETPELREAVRQTGRRRLVCAGVATDVGLALTSLSALASGYSIYALVDVSGTFDSRIEQAAWLRLSQAGVTLTSWTGFIGECQGDYTREPGPRLRELIGEALGGRRAPDHHIF